MYVKYDENEEIVALFIGCIHSDPKGFIEIPDDEAVAKEFVKKHSSENTEATQEERINALENQLAAYEAAYAEGVNEA